MSLIYFKRKSIFFSFLNSVLSLALTGESFPKNIITVYHESLQHTGDTLRQTGRMV